MPAAAGQIVLSLDSDVAPESVSGYVVGKKDLLTLERAISGEYFINNIPAGTHDVVIIGKSKSTALWNLLLGNDKSNSVDKGTRLKKVEVLNGARTKKEKVALPPLISASGIAKLADKTDHAGIQVYIPGTEYIALTASDGSFSISGVPVGIHNFFFEKDGYHRGQLEEQDAKSGTNVLISDIHLAIDTGADGFILIQNGSALVDSRKVNLTIGATADAVLMKISEKDNFEGAGWQPLKSNFQYTFATPGDKTLYAMFANANGLASSPYSAKVKVDIFSDNKSTFSSTLSVADVTPPANVFSAKISVLPKNATQMMISLNNQFTGAAWENTALQKDLTFEKDYANCGQKQFYLKFKDAQDFESPTLNATPTVHCWKPTSTVGAPEARERHTAVSTGTKMIVWGGLGIQSQSSLQNGKIYNSTTDSWSTMSLVNAPSAMSRHSAIWTGSKMIVWGGSADFSTSNGAIYDLDNDTWSPISAVGAPSPRVLHSAVWTGSKMIIFGGNSGRDNGCPNTPICGDGAIYDLANNTWTPLPIAGALSARHSHLAYFKDDEMNIWGGCSTGNMECNSNHKDFWSYSILNNSWQTKNTISDSLNRWNYSSVFQNGILTIFGGRTQSTSQLTSILNFDHSIASWKNSVNLLPDHRYGATAIAINDSQFLIWGGRISLPGSNTITTTTNTGYIFSQF